MTESVVSQIEEAAREMRLLHAEMSRAFPCYLGSSLSATDILAVLYFSVMGASSTSARRLLTPPPPAAPFTPRRSTAWWDW